MALTILKAPAKIVFDYNLPSNKVIFLCSCSSGNGFLIKCVDDGVQYKIMGSADMIDRWDEVGEL